MNKLGGKSCGWLEQEQDDFLNLLIKNKWNFESKQFRKQLERAFPLFNETELDLHINNFKEYTLLE